MPRRGSHRPGSRRRDRKRGAWRLEAAGVGPRLVGIPVPALVGDFQIPEQEIQELDELDESVGALGHAPWCLTHHGGIPTVRTCSDSHRETTLRDVVEGDHLAGQGYGVPKVRRCNKCSDPQAAGGGGGCGQGRHRGEPGRIPQVTPSDVIEGPGVVETESLGTSPPVCRDRPPIIGQDQHSDAHDQEIRSAARGLGEPTRLTEEQPPVRKRPAVDPVEGDIVDQTHPAHMCCNRQHCRPV